MQPGFPTTCPPGDHEDFIKFFDTLDIGGGPSTRVTPGTPYSQYYRHQIDGLKQGPALYCPEEELTEFSGIFEALTTKHVVTVCPQGDWPGEMDVDGQAIVFTEPRADRLFVSWAANLEFESYGESGQLTNWELTGLKRFTNCLPVELRPAEGRLEVTIAYDSGTGLYTVTALRDGVEVASGTTDDPTSTVTLEEVNDSGVNGTVDLNYSADVSEDAYLAIRWPKSYKIHYKTSAFIAGDFSPVMRTAEATVEDDGRSNEFEYRSGPLNAATYYVVIHQVDDADNEGTSAQSGGVQVEIKAPPEPAGMPEYASGDYSSTVVEFAASSTTLATYNVYDSGENGTVDLDTPAVTVLAGTGTLSAVLPAIGATFTGIRRVVVRAENGGIEEGSIQQLEIEYDNGVVILPRPNAPAPGKHITVSGKTITVPFSVNTLRERVSAEAIEIYLFQLPGSPAYASPDNSDPIPAANGVVKQSSISATAGSNGLWWFAIRTVSDDGVSSDNTDYYGPVFLEDTAAEDPVDIIARPGAT